MAGELRRVVEGEVAAAVFGGDARVHAQHPFQLPGGQRGQPEGQSGSFRLEERPGRAGRGDGGGAGHRLGAGDQNLHGRGISEGSGDSETKG